MLHGRQVLLSWLFLLRRVAQRIAPAVKAEVRIAVFRSGGEALVSGWYHRSR
jgi:hypothetical protein